MLIKPILLLLSFLLIGFTAATEPLIVGSKRFTESYILGEIIAETARLAGDPVRHRPGLGNTAIVLNALQTGDIDLYPEYTGTIAKEILKLSSVPTLDELNKNLVPLGLAAAVPLGFNNTYALAVRGEIAASRKIKTLSDLALHQDLRFGLSQEFIGRADGWPGLKQIYGLLQTPIGLDHGLAYEAIAAGQIDVLDIYSTDAKIGKYALRVLIDDRRYFPAYDAVLLYRLDLPQRFPSSWQRLQALEGSLDAEKMIALNAQVELEGKTYTAVARDWLKPSAGGSASRSNAWQKLWGEDFWRLTIQHMGLVLGSLFAAILLGVPLGIWAAKHSLLRQPLLAMVGVLQTIPSLALLAFLIPVLGMIGIVPALVALFLYALLPIVRNTCTGLLQIPKGLKQAALALGLSNSVRLWRIEIPLAARTIITGVKTSAVINVGTATIAAFIGAGGYGERIVQGLALNDNTLLLAGAIPAALLALIVQGLFEFIERYWLPRDH